jgi:ACS family hexuronate transporter-like MFS transporter
MVICGLLFLGGTKNYMDRHVLGVLEGPLQHEFRWNEIDYGNLVFAFQAAYALGMILDPCAEPKARACIDWTRVSR